MLLRCLVSFGMVATILTQERIAPIITSKSSEVLMTDTDSKLQCSLVGYSNNGRMGASTGVYKVAFDYDAPTIDPIRNNRIIHLDGKASNNFTVMNSYDEKGYSWCMSSFEVYNKVRYLSTTTKIRVLPSTPESKKKMKLPDSFKIKKNQDYVIQIENYECAAARGCSFKVRSEKFRDGEFQFVRYEDYISVDPTTGKLYIPKANFSPVGAEKFTLIILNKPPGTQSILDILKLNVDYDDNGSRDNKEMQLLPNEGSKIEKIVYDGQYGVSLVCIPTERVAVRWYNSSGEIATKNTNEHSFDKFGWIMYIKKATKTTAGEYRCEAIYKAQKSDRTFNVKIFKPAKITTKQQENVIVKVNEYDASLSCKAEGTGEIKMLWRIIKFGSSSTPNVEDRSQERGTDSVEINYKNRITESVTIICYAENILGGFGGNKKKFFVDSLSYTIYIIRNMTIERQPKDQNHALDEEASLQVALRHGNLFKRNCRWFKDGEKVSASRKVIVDYPSPDVIACILQIENIKVEDEGKYHLEVDDGVTTLLTNSMTLSVLGTPGDGGPNKVVTGSSLANLWWILLVILFIIVVVVVIIVICLYLQRNKGDEYNIDKLERKQGLDPEKELRDEEFKHYQRAEEPRMSSKASLNSTVSLGEDDDNSLLEYGEPDSSKFNEDGSFIEEYGTGRRNGRTDTDV